MDPELRELLDALLDVNRLQSEQVRDLAECVKILDRRLTLLEERSGLRNLIMEPATWPETVRPYHARKDVVVEDVAWHPESRKA